MHVLSTLLLLLALIHQHTHSGYGKPYQRQTSLCAHTHTYTLTHRTSQPFSASFASFACQPVLCLGIKILSINKILSTLGDHFQPSLFCVPPSFYLLPMPLPSTFLQHSQQSSTLYSPAKLSKNRQQSQTNNKTCSQLQFARLLSLCSPREPAVAL